jgi:hypothetical protein
LLTSAIFSHFTGFELSENDILDDAEKLHKIIENLKIQQNVVRQNMVFLTQQRADYIQARAQRDIRHLQENTNPADLEEETVRAIETTEMLRHPQKSSLLTRLKASPKQDSKPEDFLFTMRELNDSSTINTSSPAEDRLLNDTDMSGITFNTRTASTIREEAAKDLQEIINLTTGELEGYDIHSKYVIDRYKTALERRASTGVDALGTMPPPKSV